MKLWPFGRKAEQKSRGPIEVKTLGKNDVLAQLLGLTEAGTASTATSAMRLYEQSSGVSIPINLIGEAFAMLDPILIQDEEKITESPVLDLLKMPSPFYSQELFLEVLGKDWLITGESGLIAIGNPDRPPLDLQPINPSVLTAVRGYESTDAAGSWQVSGNTLPGQYSAVASQGGRVVRYIDQSGLKELRVQRSYSTRDSSLLRGQSLLLSASREARQQILGTEHNVSLLENGGRVSLIFHFKGDFEPDDYEITKQRVMEEFSGPDNAGKISVTAGDNELNIQEIGTRPKDMDYENLQAIARKAIALTYKVPLPLISDERQTLNNYREGKLALFDDAVLPLADRIFGNLSSFLLPRFGLDPRRIRISYDPDTIPALRERRLDELIKRHSLGVETDNETRAALGREPYEGGDVILKPATLVPAGTDPFVEDEDPDRLELVGGREGGGGD